MTLGMLIASLGTKPLDQSVRFDFGAFVPREVDSYRGYYDQLALGYDDDWRSEVTVKDLSARLKAVRGKTLTGYKGGDFLMTDATRIWAANYGQCHSTAIVGLADCDWMTVIATAFRDD